MPTLALHPGATILVTGVNGLIGSHIADQLLARGYHVRGAVRDVKRMTWLKQYFNEKRKSARFEMVEVPDMTVAGCYDQHVTGTQGFIHTASPLGGILSVDAALAIGRKAGFNALEACAKSDSVTRFVNTSSSFAATLPKPGLEQEYTVGDWEFNDAVLGEARVEETSRKGLLVYAAMKSETEKGMWEWVREREGGFVMNSILPNANFGPVLVPQHQGFPSTIDWAHAAWTGEYLEQYASGIQPQWFISPLDSALLHVAALIYADVDGERLFGFAERWNFNELLAIFRRNYPGKTFPEDLKGQGEDMVRVPTVRAEEVLRWVKGRGWDGLEESVVAMSKDW